jgi:Sulfotransferase domain
MIARITMSTPMYANTTQRGPDFIVIGAMKCATTTLHAQLSRQPGLYMTRLKEPNFFSDDEVFAKGLEWYESLFRDAGEGKIRGESSTHYTKLPTHPRTLERMSATLPHVKLIYVMRHPIDRLISQYVHEQTVGRIVGGVGIHEAIERLPELVDFGRYAMQLKPYLEIYGAEMILPVFTHGLNRRPQAELERIGRFLGCPGPLRWDKALRAQNVGSERLRKSALREVLVHAPLLSSIRRRILPKAWTESFKALWRARVEPPPVPPEFSRHLEDLFNRELKELGNWLGIELTCENFREVTTARSHDWLGVRR